MSQCGGGGGGGEIKLQERLLNEGSGQKQYFVLRTFCIAHILYFVSASRIKRFYKLFIQMQAIENIRKNSGKYGSISFFFFLKYIKAMTFLVLHLEANNVLL
jgi:hypothetical protein